MLGSNVWPSVPHTETQGQKFGPGDIAVCLGVAGSLATSLGSLRNRRLRSEASTLVHEGGARTARPPTNDHQKDVRIFGYPRSSGCGSLSRPCSSASCSLSTQAPQISCCRIVRYRAAIRTHGRGVWQLWPPGTYCTFAGTALGDAAADPSRTWNRPSPWRGVIVLVLGSSAVVFAVVHHRTRPEDS